VTPRRLALAAACAAGVLMAVQARASSRPASGTVSFLAGEATITWKPVGEPGGAAIRKGGSRALTRGDTVGEGDVLETGRRSRLEVKLRDGSAIRLGPNARIVLDTARFTNDEKRREVSVRLQVGNAWAKVAKAAGGEARFEIRTDNAVAGVRGTTFRVDASKDRSVVVKVYSGSVAVAAGPVPRRAHGEAAPAGQQERRQVAGPSEVTREAWERIVTSMMEVRVAADGTPSEPRRFSLAASGADEWERWNLERDGARGNGGGGDGPAR
jgi:hypothetical protein